MPLAVSDVCHRQILFLFRSKFIDGRPGILVEQVIFFLCPGAMGDGYDCCAILAAIVLPPLVSSIFYCILLSAMCSVMNKNKFMTNSRYIMHDVHALDMYGAITQFMQQ